MIIKYVNHMGQEVNLNQKPYKMLISDLLDYEWEVCTSANKIVGFGYDVKEKSLNIDVHRDSVASARENTNALTELFEIDILSGAPGKLYIDEQYMVCYIKSSEKDNWETNQIIQCEYGIITDHPFWIRERPYYFKSAEITSTNNKRYPGRHAYRYANGLNNTSITNEHYAECNFLLRIYGPCLKPSVYIGGHEYHVDITLEDGEYLEIDSAEETVIKYMSSGIRVNAFHNRSFQNSVFLPIQTGQQDVFWDGKFDFDLILYEERSEPRWS